MEIYFDKNCFNVLKDIYKRGLQGITWSDLRKKHGDNADEQFLINLSKELYICTKDSEGMWINYAGGQAPVVEPKKFRSYCTPKGNAFIEERRYNFRRWFIPTVISIISLLISIFTLGLNIVL